MFLQKLFSNRNLISKTTNLLQKNNNQLRYNISFMQKNKKSLEEKAVDSQNNPTQKMGGGAGMEGMNPQDMNNAQEMMKKAAQIQELEPEEQKKSVADEQVEELLRQQEEEQVEYEKQVQIMHENHKALQKELDTELDIPFKLYGWLDVPETNTAYMGERVFAQHRIPKHQILNHLYKIFTGTLYSLAECDSEFLNEYCEKQFAEKLVKSVDQLKEKGYRFKVVEDVTGIGGEPISKFYYISDMILVRGLDVEREKNLSYEEYHEYKDIDDMGMVIYTPHSLSNPLNFIDPETNENIYDPYKKVVMRCLVPIRSPLRLQVFRNGNEDEMGDQIIVDDDLYTWEHVAVFETQMKPPAQFKSSYKLENYMEWLGKFQFGTWKLVDLDNWMEGNPLIIKGTKRNLYTDPIFKGSKYDPSASVSIKNI